MKKIYNPKEIEHLIYQDWENQNYFDTVINKLKKENFCIMLPPPNITGYLHMGHAFQQVIMDTIIRYQRMNGKNILWQIGTDHAGIATQILVEKNILLETGQKKQEYDREYFIKKVVSWKENSIKKIFYQMKRLGNSADWKRSRFTLDEGFSKSVKEAFISLYKNKLIYRIKSLVNWDTKLCSAISDLEVEIKETKGYIWYIRYPIIYKKFNNLEKKYLVVATTRPETILADTAIAVNPKDNRYKDIIGKYVIVPIINRKIPIISDNHAELDKGTGCVKITPAHDFNDYKVGIRNKLMIVNIMNKDGTIREKAKIYDHNGKKSNFFCNLIPEKIKNLDRFLARKTIINELEKSGYLEKKISYISNIPYSIKSGVIIEPMLTNQWYIKSKILSGTAIKAVKENKIKFIPKQYKNMYLYWMENIEDWCISRQLWWGHRIPAWYDEKENIYVGYSEEQVRKENKIKNEIKLKQDEDVLDTWFSSSLWTFATLGWPEDTKELKTFHPTNVIISGFDIIFFWIARMIMMTMYFIKNKDGSPQIPFKKIYITGLIKDEFGRKMSKSEGNSIDPIDIIDGISLEDLLKKRTSNMIQQKLKNKIYKSTKKQFPNGIQAHGTDALRLTLLALASHSRNINFDMNRLKGYRNFCNKLWNASKFVILNTNLINIKSNEKNYKITSINIIDKWIISELNKTINLFNNAILNYRFDIAVNLLYEFTWNQFCDWYLELSKIFFSIKTKNNELYSIKKTLIYILESLLCLLHPIIPFITSYIWKKINKENIIIQTFPKYNEKEIDNKATLIINWIKQLVTISRNIRVKLKINKKIPVNIIIKNISSENELIVKNNFILLKKLINFNDISINSKINEKNLQYMHQELKDGTKIILF